jgi:hypothetical protein
VDPKRFEDLSRRFAAAATRRSALGVLAGGAAAAVLTALRPGAADASQLVKGCKIPGQKCKNEKQCCGNSHCNKGRCKCINKGGSCLVQVTADLALPTKALCCTSRCSRHDHKCR